jgi:trimeric autotransporter adhesin
VVVNRIAKWDGASWSSLGSGLNNWVYALLPDEKGNLYVGGNFTTAGEKISTFIARWEISAFHLYLPLIVK